MSDLLLLFRDLPPAFVALGGVLGMLVGSFLNVVIHRLPKMMERDWQAQCAELSGTPIPVTERYSLVFPGSACPQCGRAIRAWENIPLLSYLWLRGKCAGCGTGISRRYPLVEVLSGVFSAYAAWRFGVSWTTLAVWLFAWAMIALAFIDFDTQLLPDDITLPLLWLGLLFNLGPLFADLPAAVIGAVVGYLVLWSVYWAFKLITRKEGMGYGDFKLLAAIGAWLGWQMLPVVILLSSFVGAVVGVSLILFTRHERAQPIPFGPYLAGGGLIALFWGHDLTQAYLNWLH